TCFGAQAHKFALAEPLSESEVARFEAEYGVRLPEAYRTFLLEAGASGAGPYYGLLPLGRWRTFASFAFDDAPAGGLACPCPLVPTVPGDPPWGPVAPPGSSSGQGWLEQLGLTIDTAHEAYVGTLTVGMQGCAHATLLVVTGSQAGRIVYVDGDHVGVPYFVDNVDFLAWYERWLDEILA